MQTKNTFLSIVLGITFVYMLRADAGEVTLSGGPRPVFSTLPGDGNSVSYSPCGSIARTRTTSGGYTVDNEPYFDGAIAPISYVDGSAIKFRFNASLGSQNYRITSTYDPNTGSFSDGTLDCHPVYSPIMSSDPSDFNWAQWLYGTFIDVPNNKVYAVLYHEFYGGSYPGSNNYSALGLAVSDDKGATFHEIQPAPNHVFLKANYLWSSTGGHGYGYQGGIFQSPLDGMYYVGANSDYALAGLLRTATLADPSTWQAWDGANFDLSTVPLSQNFGNINVAPLYLGYSDYFKKYITVTTGNTTGDYSVRGNYQIVYNVSEDLVNWGPTRKIMDNPTCPQTGVCSDSISSYPSAMDPAFLSQTSDSIKASNGIIGANPLITYINQVNNGQVRQQFDVQQISFNQVDTNRLDNFSVRGVVGPEGQEIVMGFILQGAESKQLVIRALGPSLNLPADFGYPALARPGIDLRDQNGNVIASNQGWQSLPQDQLDRLNSIGFAPGNANESALVVTLLPGAYTATMYQWNGYQAATAESGVSGKRIASPDCTTCDYYGVGLLEAYDLSSLNEAKVAEVSIRGFSRPGNGALIMGFLSRGGQTAVVRGTGTSTLAPFGFSPVVPDPNISVSKNGGFLIADDNWGSDANAYAIQNTYGLAPGNSLESATLFATDVAFPAKYSSYTVTLQGTGFGLLELYNVETR